MQDKTKTVEHINQPPNYSEKVDSILATPLAVENIDYYADDALNQLIDVIEDAKKQYNNQPTVALDDETTPREQEDIVASYFGINDINQIIDHIISKSHQLDDIDDFITKIPLKAEVIILPIQNSSTQIRSGDGSFEQAGTAPKLKTLLFILENEFGINIKDPQELEISLGALPDEAMRKQGYYTVVLPRMNRTILICDEQENITFVLDSNRLLEFGISVKDFSNITKQVLKDIISTDTCIGTAINQSKKFTSKIIHLLNDPSELIDSEDDLENPSYLAGAVPEGYSSINRISKKLKVSHQTIVKAIEDLVLEPDEKYKSKVKRYSPDKVRQIHDHLEKKGIVGEATPDNFLPTSAIANEFNIDPITVAKAILFLEIKPDINKGNGYYGPEKIEQIRNRLEETKALKEQAPEGYLSLSRIADKLNLGITIIRYAVDNLGIQNDGEYKIQSKVAAVYGPEKQEKIREYLKKNGYFDAIPDGYKTAMGIATALSIDRKIVVRSINRLGVKSDGMFKIDSGIKNGYGPDKIEQIRIDIEEERRKIGKKAVKPI